MQRNDVCDCFAYIRALMLFLSIFIDFDKYCVYNTSHIQNINHLNWRKNGRTCDYCQSIISHLGKTS